MSIMPIDANHACICMSMMLSVGVYVMIIRYMDSSLGPGVLLAHLPGHCMPSSVFVVIVRFIIGGVVFVWHQHKLP